ncbi:MAG TPA: sulfite exporter TauE/SafE family protein [Rectinemataceae bacterium]|nr:sulfite exporter TauE/SafE family protein [Rectinemataceae bacterium]
MSFTIVGIFILCATALLTGIAKTGIPGLGMLVVPLIAMAMPVRESTGFLLPILISGDVMAVLYWHRSAHWEHLGRILLWTAAGVVLGFALMRVLSEAVFKPLLGGMIIAFVALDLVRRFAKIELRSESRLFAATIGIAAGAFTMLANAAGPVMTIYLLSMGLPKEEFVGTGAWFYFLINLFKAPFSVALGLLTWRAVKVDLMLLPLVAAGGVLGIVAMRRLPQRVFDLTAQILAALGGLKLFL